MDRQREMFEAWYSKHCEPGVGPWFVRDKDNSDEYYMSHTQTAWDAWQAAIAAQWQPIETAPKDGTAILAMLPGSDISHSIRWNEINRGWCLTWDGWKLGQYNQPTRWMPMPPEPTK